MNKVTLFCILLLICGVVFASYLGYTFVHRSSGQHAICSTDVFELNLFSDKEVYKTTDAIQIWATLEYVGDYDTIKIWHSLPYILFLITDGDGFNIGGIQMSVLTSSILEKGEIYHFDFQKSGAWDSCDPDASFWEAFFNETDLFLPAGEYTITVKGDFYLTDKVEGDSGLLCEFKIRVE
jgi:hypothetical protein